MSLATYADVKAAIAKWTHRADLGDAIPEFITLAEAKMNRQLRVQQMEADTTIALSTSVLLPADYVGLRMIRLASDNTKIDYQEIKNGIITFRDGVTGDATLSYYQKIPALSDTNTSNWVLFDYPDAYIYGALAESAPYTGNDARLQIWGSAFQATLAAIVRDDKVRRHSGRPRVKAA